MLSFVWRAILLLLLFLLALCGVLKLADIFSLKENLKEDLTGYYTWRTILLIVTVVILYAAIAAIMVSFN
jgi:uncharacterized membrane protein